MLVLRFRIVRIGELTQLPALLTIEPPFVPGYSMVQNCLFHYLTFNRLEGGNEVRDSKNAVGMKGILVSA
jgi:hypothetical protein